MRVMKTNGVPTPCTLVTVQPEEDTSSALLSDLVASARTALALGKGTPLQTTL